MPSTLFLVFTYLTEALIVFYYAKSIYEYKKDAKISFAATILLYALLLIIYKFIFNIALLNALLVFIVNFVIFYFLFKSSLKSSLFHSVVLVFMQIFAEVLAMIITGAAFKISSVEVIEERYEFGTVISRLIYLSLAVIIARITTKLSGKRHIGKWFAMGTLPLGSIIAVSAFYTLCAEIKMSTRQLYTCIIAISVILIANIVVYYVYESSERNSQKLLELELEQHKNKADMQYLTLLEEKNQQMQIMAHDYKNHLFALSQMSDNAEVKSYIEKISGEIQKAEKGCDSGNHTLDILLNKYITESERKGISFEYDVKLANLNFVEDYDLVTIVGNLLDNALEAAEQSAEKKISLNTAKVNTYDSLTVTNSCDTPPDKNLKTTKKNKQMHGLGIKSIQKAVKKYDGELEWEYDESEKQFSITIILLSKTV